MYRFLPLVALLFLGLAPATQSQEMQSYEGLALPCMSAIGRYVYQDHDTLDEIKANCVSAQNEDALQAVMDYREALSTFSKPYLDVCHIQWREDWSPERFWLSGAQGETFFSKRRVDIPEDIDAVSLEVFDRFELDEVALYKLKFSGAIGQEWDKKACYSYQMNKRFLENDFVAYIHHADVEKRALDGRLQDGYALVVWQILRFTEGHVPMKQKWLEVLSQIDAENDDIDYSKYIDALKAVIEKDSAE